MYHDLELALGSWLGSRLGPPNHTEGPGFGRAFLLGPFVTPALSIRPIAAPVRMKQALTTLELRSPGQGLLDITAEVADWVAGQAIGTGLLTLFCRHTSASLLIQENAAPAARRDLERWFGRIAPEGAGYEHADEGPDDMPAHLRSAITQTHLAIPVAEGRPALGTWQGIYLFEHRRSGQRRQIMLHLIGE